ncbi:phenylacetone monooxygenase [Pseudovirgaria hyperparasitica]|uniref:Phenylacetone monooxygenase n=1 Tax=Pseudovirgaria hyperparasitica TaxID=470096 RepID=A0A6A6W353_9PEZI|nr:phenylacetone monooxygenase [Pseudovirgaria hyperparasitica]KAF2756360.1 phenylacetone monooxygenase [Pseudovirgaria hyperparasitica]
MAATDTHHDAVEMPFDPNKIQAIYDEQRNLRLNDEDTQRYRHVTGGGFGVAQKHGNTESKFIRDGISAKYEVIIVGGGFGGLLSAIQLLKSGIQDFAIIEQGRDFGGTWYWNKYPGAQCDVESYIYLPLLEEVNYMPKEKYSYAPEIFRHAQTLGRHFGLYSKALFQTTVKSLHWSGSSHLWKVETDQSDHLSARWVVLCPGNQSTPRFPNIPGVESFQGASFHTSRWDYSYTKGEGDGKLLGLKGKRVGIIGTGASAVQVVPNVADYAQHLFVFQRTPSSISVRNNHPTSEPWALSLGYGWQRRRMDNFHAITTGIADPNEGDLVNDAWTTMLRKVAGGLSTKNSGSNGNPAQPDLQQMAQASQLADFEVMEGIRARVDRVVTKNSDTASALKPWYNLLCKRPCFHDGYLQTFNKENVTLVDTSGKGVEAVTSEGVVVRGQHIELDCIIYATGFAWQTEWTERTGIQIFGRDGLPITKKWAEGMSTFHGWGTHGFPNLILMTHAQSGLSVNYTHTIIEKAEHMAYIIESCRARGIQAVEPTGEAENAWVHECLRVAEPRNEFLRRCTPSYFNYEGQMSTKLLRSNFYSGSPNEYQRELTRWRENGELEGLILHY